MANMIQFQGRFQEKILDIPVTEQDKEEIFRKTKIRLKANTKVIHILSNDIHQYSSRNGGDESIKDFFDILNWDYYNKLQTPLPTIEELSKSNNFAIDCENKDKVLEASVYMCKFTGGIPLTLKTVANNRRLFYYPTANTWDFAGKSPNKNRKIISFSDYLKIMGVEPKTVAGEPMKDTIYLLMLKGYRDHRDQKYKKIKSLANHNTSNLSSFQCLVKDKNGFRLLKDLPSGEYVKYEMENFNGFLKAVQNVPEPVLAQDVWMLDISAIHDENNLRYKQLFRISSTFRKEQILENSFIRSINGEMIFIPSGTTTKSTFEKTYPDAKIYSSIDEHDLYRRLKKHTPEKFIPGVEYIVREYEDMKTEFGLKSGSETTLGNKNKFPNANRRHCGIKFTVPEETGNYKIKANSIFPEETYEVSTMANPNLTANAENINIFTDEAIPEPPKPKPIHIRKVGTKYYQGKKEVNLEEITAEIEVEEMQVNEKRFVASIELGIEYDNLEEKSKRIQDTILNELDSPEAIADKEWVYIYGGSGSGKTTEAVKYFKSKGQQFIKQAGFGQLTGDDLLGYKSITDHSYSPSLLRQAVENGYGFILDEMDACNPNTLLVLNELKGEEMQFPDKKIKIHPDFRLIATGNTVGFSEDYNARQKLDRATSARFSTVEYNLTLLDIGERWGGSYAAKVKDIGNKEPREIQREIRQMKQKEGKTNA